VKEVHQPHGRAGLACARGHDQKRAALAGCERLGHAADGLVLIGAVHDGTVDHLRGQRVPLLADKAQALEIGPREKACHHARMGLPDFPEAGGQPIRHETERREGLLTGDAVHVKAELLLSFTGVAGRALALDYREHAAVLVVETVVSDAPRDCSSVRCCWRLAHGMVGGHLAANLRAVVEPPAGFFQLAVNQLSARLMFSQSHVQVIPSTVNQCAILEFSLWWRRRKESNAIRLEIT